MPCLVATVQRTAQSNHLHRQNTIAVRGQQVTVSAEQVKPAYILERTQHDTGSPKAQPNKTGHTDPASKNYTL
jgi:hypothetical protein